MRSSLLVIAICLAEGCGRLGFADRVVDAPAVDALPDAPLAPAVLVQALAAPYTHSATFPVPITYDAGHLLVVGVYWNTSLGPVTVTDTEGLAWHQLPLQNSPCGDECGESIEALWYARAPAGATSTITATQPNAACPFGVFVLDYAGATDTVLDAAGAIAQVQSDAATPPLTTTRPSVLVAMYTDGTGTGDFIPGAGFTLAATDTGWFSTIATRDNVPAGTYSPTAMLPPGHTEACWSATAVAFAIGP